MASKFSFLSIWSLLLLLLLLLLSTALAKRLSLSAPKTHRLGVAEFNFFPKGFPVPPSGPSQRQNQELHIVAASLPSSHKEPTNRR